MTPLLWPRNTENDDFYNTITMYLEKQKMMFEKNYFCYNLQRAVMYVVYIYQRRLTFVEVLFKNKEMTLRLGYFIVSSRHSSNRVLCCRPDSYAEEIMKTVMCIVNFIRAKSSLRHRQMQSLIQETVTQLEDFLFHYNVRLLSKGNIFLFTQLNRTISS